MEQSKTKLAAKHARESERSRKTADRLLDKQGVFPVRDVFETSVEQAQKKLRRKFRGQLRQEVTPKIMTDMRRELTKLTTDLGSDIGDAMSHSTRETLKESLRSASRFMHQMTGKASAIDDPVVVDEILREQAPIIQKRRDHTAQIIAAALLLALLLQMKKRAKKEPTLSDLIEGVEVEFESQWWRIERYVRTETSLAYNAVQSAAYMAIGARVPEFRVRWTERVNDQTNKPMDNRVGDDSLVLHGQLTTLGGDFTMPPSTLAPSKMVGASWKHPPNRPNDRAIITPWQAGWGVPGYVYSNGTITRV